MLGPTELTESVLRFVEDNWSLDLTLAQWWCCLAEAGLAFPTWPVGVGGRGVSATEARSIRVALDAAGTIAAPAGNGPNMGGPTLIEHATPEQIERFVLPMARGEAQWCQLFSEPGAGSDLAGLSTRAVCDGEEFVVSGQKVWNSKADVSEWGLLLCRTDPGVPKHAGITFMMIDLRQPGVEVRPIVQMNGASEFSEVFLTDARVPYENVIGSVGGGWDVARTTLRHERAASAAVTNGSILVEAGSIAGNLDRQVGDLIEEWSAAGGARRRQPPLLGARSMVELARSRGALAEAALRDRLVRFHIHSELYLLNGRRTRDLARAGVPTALDGSLLKLDLAALAHESRDLSYDILGPAAMLTGGSAPDGGKVATTGLSAFIPSLGGGTNEIQRNIVSERTLGLPREPAVDADVPFRDVRRTT